jgi:hypothetical protein
VSFLPFIGLFISNLSRHTKRGILFFGRNRNQRKRITINPGGILAKKSSFFPEKKSKYFHNLTKGDGYQSNCDHTNASICV